jgi:hypothetical protein
LDYCSSLNCSDKICKKRKIDSFERKVIADGVTLTIVRDPVDAFESGYVYLGLQKHYNLDINEFAYRYARTGVRRPQRAFFHKNNQLYDLGLSESLLEDGDEVMKKIQQLSNV